jgi:glutathione S-transferase
MSSFCSSSEGFTGAHQNTLENVPVVVVTWVFLSSRTFRGLITLLTNYRTLIGGLRYPIPAAVACGLWTFTRIIYTIRYGTGEPKKVFPFLLKFTLVSESYS